MGRYVRDVGEAEVGEVEGRASSRSRKESRLRERREASEGDEGLGGRRVPSRERMRLRGREADGYGEGSTTTGPTGRGEKA